MKIFKGKSVEFTKEKEVKTVPSFMGSVKDYFGPQLISQENISKQMRFVMFLALLAVLFITNQFHAEKVVNDVDKLKKLRDEKRAEYISTASDLMKITRQSEVIKLIENQNIGLKPLTQPPLKIEINKEN